MSKKHRVKGSSDGMKDIKAEVKKVDKDVKEVGKEVRLFAKFEGLMAEIIIILLVGICVGTIAGYWFGSLGAQASQNQGGTGPTVNVETLKLDVQDYINKNLLQENGVTAVASKVTDLGNGIYEMTFDILQDGNKVSEGTVYATEKKLILGQAFDLNTPLPTQETPTTPETPSTAYTKSEVPEVKLFIMAFCPYGIQAATAFQSAIELLNEKMNFKMGYVIYSNYAKQGGTKWEDYCTDSSEKYCSMHGINEVKEDVRQMCIQKYAPDKFWAYMTKLMADYGNSAVSAANIADKWEGYATAAGIDVAQIKTCASSEQDVLLAEQVALNSQYSVSGSPTALINGTQYSGDRAADAFKSAICSAFTNAPADCNTSLSTSAGTASGSC
ncbi:MAG: thioredoxin domain-containing protein [Candidatus Diapherotrites archaeon]|nr:thioredoxin domain-containing protein [Candidatus Diapherotrites archaeon]